MAECDNCGGWVTDEYKRVFSDNDGVLHGCIECTRLAGGHHPDDAGEVN